MPLYRVPPRETWQLQNGDPYGGSNCSAWSANGLLNRVTEGRKNSSGERIRQLSSEPKPDPRSPGLTLPQVCDVLEDYFDQPMDVRIAYRALTFEEYEAKRVNGKPALIQVGYSAIADSPYDAGNGFRGNHMMFEDNSGTYDTLADGRHPGVYRNGGSLVYPRDVMKRAAGLLVISQPGRPTVRVGFGRVWCAFGVDVLPPYHAEVKPRAGRKTRNFNAYTIKDGRITGYVKRTTRGFDAHCNPPRVVAWQAHGMRYVVKLTEGPFKGSYINAHWAEES